MLVFSILLALLHESDSLLSCFLSHSESPQVAPRGGADIAIKLKLHIQTKKRKGKIWHCQAERCYKNRTHQGCTDVAGCGSFSSAVNCTKVAEPCCCEKDWCNGVSTTAETSSEESSARKYWPHIVVLVLACIAFIGYLTFLVMKGKIVIGKTPRERSIRNDSKREKSSRSRSSSRSRRRRYTSNSEDSPQTSEPVWEKEREDDMIDHVDMTHVKVEATIPSETKKGILDYLKKGAPPLEHRKKFLNSPKIVRIMTYGASEHITLLESPPSSNASKGSQKAIGKDTAVDLLIQMIENGPREFDFNREQLQEVLRLGAQVFIEECTLLEIPVPCMVYGDTHGQYSDLLRWFNLNGWPYETRCVFLGDFVDRGSHGVELFAMLTCLKVCFPDNLFVLRGNHEEESLNQLYSFATEVYNKFDAKLPESKRSKDPMYDHFKSVFMNLPLACLIGGEILAMHGGISPKLKSLQDIREIVRPIDEFIKGTLACDLVWSDPDTLNTVAEYEPNFEREATVGIGQLFSQAAVKDVCKRLKVKMIIRGHQAPLHGYARWAGGLLITLFSAPAYKGDTEETVNLGACIEAPVSGDLIVKQLKVTETVRRKRARDVHTRHKAHRSSLLDPSHNFLEVLPNAVGNDLPLNESKIYKS